jgi:hypothetical protein
LVVNMSVPCSGLLNCQSSIEVDFDPGYFKPPYAIWQRSVLRQQPHTKHVEVNSFSHCIGHSSDQNVTLTQWPQKFRSNALAFFLLGSHQRQGSCSSTFCDCKWPKAIQSCCVCWCGHGSSVFGTKWISIGYHIDVFHVTECWYLEHLFLSHTNLRTYTKESCILAISIILWFL